MIEDERVQVKKIVVNPGCKQSLRSNLRGPSPRYKLALRLLLDIVAVRGLEIIQRRGSQWERSLERRRQPYPHVVGRH